MELSIQQRKQALIERYGAWTAHNIRLAPDTYTMGRDDGDGMRLQQVVQVIADLVEKPFGELRILDLGCMEGLFAVELAMRGAEVVAIEGREANVAKVRFVQEVLSLGNLRIEQDDARNLSVAKYGNFDVVLCLGLLYHLDWSDQFPFLRALSEVCRHMTIIDTHISLQPELAMAEGGVTYHGQWFAEHERGARADQRERALWASLDNPRSFWFTRPSLFNAVARCGFTSAYECQVPRVDWRTSDRITLIALKGQPQSIRSSEVINRTFLWPERQPSPSGPSLRGRFYHIAAWLGRPFPADLRQTVKRRLTAKR